MRVEFPFVNILTRDLRILSTLIYRSTRRIGTGMLIGAETIEVEFFRANVNAFGRMGALPEVFFPADGPVWAAVNAVRFRETVFLLAAPADTLSFAIPLANGREEFAVASVVNVQTRIFMAPA